MLKGAKVWALLAGSCLSAVAFAQPDVTVGELDAMQHYTGSGAIGGIRAYSVGTVSCNIGNQPLEWIDVPNEYLSCCGITSSGRIYPVISGNIYRMDLTTGRFRQVGQSWLKHGFCALNGTACDSCPTQSNPGCAYLMPQCSDPYSASLNGSQGGLGPKWEINPTTGDIPLNWTGQGTTGNAIFKRIQVAETELTAANSLLFVSSIYVHPQDSVNNLDNNSQSYRRFTVSGSFAPTMQGSTARQSPAIFAWRDHGLGANTPDPNVQLSAVDVPNDGRYWIGSKVVQVSTSPARWRYEYAVQNLNADRGASSFSVPINAVANITAIGFSDVAYHSGELQTGTDWTGVASGSAVTWTYANNQTDDRAENILRWDTIYNFWFEADVAPGAGSSTITMFKPGTPTTASGASYVVGGGGSFPPPNDNCATAQTVAGTSASFDTTNATTDGPLACLESGDNRINKDVWFRWTAPSAPCPGTTIIETCGSAYDTKLAVYADGCTPADGSHIACNDDTAGCQGGATANGLGSRVSFAATQGTTYLIRVGGYTNTSNVTTSGTGTLTIITPDCSPANNNCANATQVPAGTAVATGSTQFATNDGTANCGGSATSPDVWFKYTPAISENVTVRTCGSSYDTVLSIHSACGGSQLACNDDQSGQTGCGNLSSAATIPMTAGTTYFIRIAGYNGAVGNYSLDIIGGGGGVPPANNDCANRAGFAGTVNYSTAFATTDGIAHACGQTTNDIWYNFPATCTGTLDLTLSGTNYPARVVVYNDQGCVDYTTRFAGCLTGDGTMSIPVVAAQNYTIRVGGSGTATGTGTLTAVCTPAGPSCDSIDFNNDDVSPDIQDIDDFLSVFGGGPCSTDPTPGCNDIDFNNDDVSPDIVDINAFLSVFGGGPCL
jgi:hypothetical protein